MRPSFLPRGHAADAHIPNNYAIGLCPVLLSSNRSGPERSPEGLLLAIPVASRRSWAFPCPNHLTGDQFTCPYPDSVSRFCESVTSLDSQFLHPTTQIGGWNLEDNGRLVHIASR